jgi:hypothetical protein
MRVRSASVVVASLFAVAAAVVACSSGSSSDGSLTVGPADTAGQFADQYCGLIAPCCADAGLSSNGAACHAWLTLAEQQGTYDPAAGKACLAAMQQAQSQPDFCATLGGNLSSCNQVFTSSGGSVPPGGACMRDSDCTPAPGGSATCFTQFNVVDGGSNETRTCVQTTTGKAGDTPCIGDVNGDITDYSWQGTPPRQAVLCDAARGLYCDTTTHACAAFKSPGAACSSDTECGPEAYCSFQSGGSVCAARAPAGSSCAGGVQCDASSYCDPATQACIAALASGSTCSTNDQCQSKQCVNGKCGGSSNLGLWLLCGGGN